MTKATTLFTVLTVLLSATGSASAAPVYSSKNVLNSPVMVNPQFLGTATTPPPSHCSTGTDTDGDCVADTNDNCPYTSNADQADANWDRIGDACTGDWDNDGVANDSDNCYAVQNADQANQDGDSTGDVCDIDRDGDGLTNEFEMTPEVGTNPDLWDTDGDLVSDLTDCARTDKTKAVAPDCDVITVVDNVPPNPKPNPDVNEPGRDDDGDGIPNVDDNCPIIFNPGQQDGDGDGIGDLCDMFPGRRSPFLFAKGGGSGGCSLVR